MSLPAILTALKPGEAVYLPDPRRDLDRQIQALIHGKSPRMTGLRFTTSRAVAVHLRGGDAAYILRIERGAEE